MASFCGTAQTNSVFHIETEYTPLNGYRYHFNKLNPQTGVSVRLTQLPIQGYYTGYAFFNCFDHYVFQGVDTTMSNGNYVNKLYELDTLGNLIRTIPMDTATGTWYKMCLPSATSPFYYAIRWGTTTQHYQVETINALNGSRTVQQLPALQLYTYLNSDATITRNDIIWMGMLDQMTGSDILLSLDPLNGTLSFEDTLLPGNYYDCLVYDCPNDTIYGFLAHQDTVQGAELLKIHGSSANVIHSGITATGPGIFWGGVHARLADGSFYAKGSQQNFLLPDFNVTSPTFAMPPAAATSVVSFCFAAPRESCVHYTPCTEETSTAEHGAPAGAAVYPNPVNAGALSIQQSGSFTYEVMDAAGRLIVAGKAMNQVNVDLSGVAAGVYVVRVVQDEQSVSKKIVVNN
jgi:hypothetical protein